MSTKPKITAFRIHHELERQSKIELLDYSFELGQRIKGFTPQRHRNIDFTIISAREIAVAYKDAPEYSKIKTEHHKVYQRRVADYMDKNLTFNNGHIINTFENDNKNLCFPENTSNRFLAFNLGSLLLKNEILDGINAVEEITNIRPAIKEPILILGTLSAEADSAEAESIAEEALVSDAFNLSVIRLLPGIVKQDIRTSILTPRAISFA